MESSSADRVIVLVDMDCFYVQVEQKLCPEYLGKPCAVVQYKTWKGGGIIAVNYEARARGVTRFLRGDEAVEKCPDIHLFRVPEIRGKAELSRYREAGALVMDVLCEYSDCVERASIDEAYLDMTSVINSKIQNTPPVTPDQLPNTFVIGWEGEDPESKKTELKKWLQMIYEEDHLYNDRMLAVAAVIVEEMRAAVYEKTGYRCSAGIAHNKMLAKLSCGINKPNKQTVLPQSSVQILFNTIPIKKVRNLGGKLGKAIAEKFSAEKMGDLIDVPKSQFVNQFGEKTGHWLYNLVRGLDNEQVTSRQLPKSIGCGKNFPGKSALSTRHDITYWLKQLATELEERLIKDQQTNKRFARLLTVSIRNLESAGYALVSRSCPIHVYNAEKLAHDALTAISKLNTSSSDTLWKPCVYTLSMAASKFEDRLDNSHCNIQSYLVNNKSPGSKDGTKNKQMLSASETTLNPKSNVKTVDPLNRSISLSSKHSDSSNRSIASFFTRKKVTKSESSDNVDNTKKNDDPIVKEKDDPNLSHKSDLNFSHKGDQDLVSCLVIEESDEDSMSNELFSDTKGKDSSEENSNHFIHDQIVCQKDNSDLSHTSNENLSLKDGQDSPSCLVIEESGEDSLSNVTLTDVTKKENVEENSSDSTTKPTKPMGFFAKKLAERAEFNFDLEFEPSCDSNNIGNEDLKTRNESITNANITPQPSTSSIHNYESDLDPELTKLCEQCNQRIPIWEEIEHLDYHMALSLSKELSKPIITGNNSHVNKSSNTVSKSKLSTNRKRGRATKASSQAKKSFIQKNTLDAFIK